jgi:DNA modification methylase
MPSTRPIVTLAQLIELRRATPPPPQGVVRSLSDRFLLPPFSVLDARQGYWQKRKKMWLELGIQSELGRGEGANSVSPQALEAKGGFENHPAHRSRLANGHPIPGGGTGKNSDYMFRKDGGYSSLKKQEGRRLAKAYNIGMKANKDNDWQVEDDQGSGTSIFDPVLCEIAYRWFCPKGGAVLDPFAGGSVRGIVAAKLGRSYVGIDLRQEQVEANAIQGAEICPELPVKWIVGDSKEAKRLAPSNYDLIFGGPPFADLERYSDDPRDLSTMEYPKFIEVYREIISECCSMLKDDRFAIFNTSNIRDRKTGIYHNFVGDTVDAFRSAGLDFYNEAILVTAVGSLPIRVGKQFANYRKLGKTHQQLMVFVKGDPAHASAACGEVDIDDMEMPECVVGGVAVCRKDARDTILQDWIMDPDEDVDISHIYLPPIESYLAVDVARGAVRAGGGSIRVWIGTEDGWRSVPDGEELTYLVGELVYLNQAVFPGASRPTDVAPPTPSSLR